MLSDHGPVRRRMAAKRRMKFEGLNLEPVAAVQTRSLRGRTVKIETSPLSGQFSSLTDSEMTINGTPGDNIEEQAKLTAEGLPEDWIKEVKPKRDNFRRKEMFYVEPKTGYAFHSLEDAVRYIQTGSILNCVVIPQKRSREELFVLMNNSETRSMPSQTVKTLTATGLSEVKLDGVPDNWIKEVKPRKKNSNRKDSFYIDPKTGYAFFSLKDALRYMETGDILSCATKPQKRSMEEIRILSSQLTKTEIAASPTPNLITDDEKSGELQCKVVQENQLTSTGLPTSWIKELKPRKDGSMYQFYIDPDTQYAFCSLKDALRYVATGNILSCVVRPRKRSIEEVQALMMSCKMSSIFGMKTVQHESLQCIQPHTLNRKRKRSHMKTKGTKSATRPASRRVKQCREGLLSVRASPRLLALKAEHKADANHEENDWCNTMPGMSNSSAPSNLGRELNSQPDPKSKEEVMTENGSLTRNLSHQEKTRTSLGASFCLAAQKVTSDTTFENGNGMMSNLLEPSPSPSYPSELELKETMEWANGSSTKTRSRGGMVHKERRPPLRASSRLAAQKVTNDATSVKNENSMMSNALFEPLPSPSYPNVRPSGQPEAELNDKTTEGANSCSTTSLCRVQMRRERPTPCRASPRLAAVDATGDGTSVENENSLMSNALFGCLPSPSYPNLGPASQPEVELNSKTIEGGNSSSTTSLHRVQMRRERPTQHRASSRLAAVDATSDGTSVENENSAMSDALFGGNSSPTTSLHRVQMRRERPTQHRASSRLAAVDATSDGTSVENENSAMSDALFGSLPSLPSHLPLKSTSQPEAELNDKTLEGANSSSTTSLPRVQMRRERPTLRRASTSQPYLLALPSPSHPNLKSTSQPEAELNGKTLDGANSSSTTSLRRVHMRRERPTPRRAPSRLAAVDPTSDGTSVENKMNDALFGPLPSLSYPNLRPTNQSEKQRTTRRRGNKKIFELNDKTIEGANSSLTTSLHRVQMHSERPTPCRASSCLAAVDARSDVTSVENRNSVMNSALFGPVPTISYPNLRPTSQTKAELNDKTIEGANSSSTTSLRGVQMRRGPTSHRASSCLAAVDATSDGTSVQNENCFVNHAFFNPSLSFSSVNTTSVSQPDLELKEARIQAASGSLFEASLQRGKEHMEKPVALEGSSHQASFKATTNCTAGKIEYSYVSNSFFEPSTTRPDLNLESTSSPAMEFEELTTAANERGSRTFLQKEELLGERPATIRSSSYQSAVRGCLGTTSGGNHGNDKRTCNAVSGLSFPTAHPDLNFGPTSQPYIEAKEDAANDSAIRTISKRVEPHRELPVAVKASPSLEALRVTSGTASCKINEKNSITTNAWSQPSHFPGRPDLNLGPTSQLTMEHHEENMNASETGSTLWRMNLHGVRSTPVVSMSEAPSCYNYESNFKISNYFCEPVESPANQIIMGSTSQPNPVEVQLGTTTAGPSSVIAASKIAPDLNMVPVSWPEPVYSSERPLAVNPGPRLAQQQQPAGVNTVGDFHFQPPINSEMPYQDPTMDALLSGQEVCPSMPHMSIDALNSPVSPFFGDFWHDPCLSYAFRTLTGGADQRQPNPSLGPQNNVNWAGARNGYPSQNPCPGGSYQRQLNPGLGPENNVNWAGARNGYSSQNPSPGSSTSRTLQNFNFGLPFPKR